MSGFRELAQRVVMGLDAARGRTPGLPTSEQLDRMESALKYAGISTPKCRIDFLREIHGVAKCITGPHIKALIEKGYKISEISEASGVCVRAIQRRYLKGAKPKPGRVVDKAIDTSNPSDKPPTHP